MELLEGQKAPDFEGITADGKKINLNDFDGKKIILYFYPKDDTPGCTKQACNLRDNHTALLEKGYAVIGVSADDEASHQKFTEKFSLPFPLIADTDKSIIEKYGVWKEKNNYGKKYMGIARTTFVIDEEKTIIKIFKRPQTDTQTEQILKALE